MLNNQSGNELTLFFNDSEKSREVKERLEQAGASFRLVYASKEDIHVPTLSGLFGTIRGYDDIVRYYLSK